MHMFPNINHPLSTVNPNREWSTPAPRLKCEHHRGLCSHPTAFRIELPGIEETEGKLREWRYLVICTFLIQRTV